MERGNYKTVELAWDKGKTFKFKRIEIKDIKEIRNKISIELQFKDLNISDERRDEVESLICCLNTWLDRRHYLELNRTGIK
ncbi:hypothetical protein ES705_45870 [subsurface metagenome]